MLDFGLGEVVDEPRKLYLDDRGEHIVLLDQVDYDWAIQWRWRPKFSRRSSPRAKLKVYAVRSVRIGGAGGRSVSLFLHKTVLIRTGRMPPSPAHIVADHEDGNSLNCRRSNLRWATSQMNRENYNGYYALQQRLAFKEGRDTRIQFGMKRGKVLA